MCRFSAEPITIGECTYDFVFSTIRDICDTAKEKISFPKGRLQMPTTVFKLFLPYLYHRRSIGNGFTNLFTTTLLCKELFNQIENCVFPKKGIILFTKEWFYSQIKDERYWQTLNFASPQREYQRNKFVSLYRLTA